VRIGVVLPRIVVAVAANGFVGSQFLQPPFVIVVQSALVIVDENGRGNKELEELGSHL
jgi:hypothetical protein